MRDRLLSVLLATAVLTGSSAWAAECSGYRFAPEPGYAFRDDTLVFPDGKTQVAKPGDRGNLRSAYGLTGPDDNMQRTIFVDSCGKPYQVGYRLEGNTLVMPNGAKHEIRNASPAEAERLLRDAYGLVGEREHLDRTKW